MGTTATVPTVRKVQKSIFDLDTFESVTLLKEVPALAPVTSVQDALTYLQNDTTKLLAVINDGLKAEQSREARKSDEGWYVEDDKGNKSEFDGTPANEKKVNGIVLTLAKLNGFEKGASKDTKRAAKETARETIKNSPPIMEMLRKSAAASDEDEE